MFSHLSPLNPSDKSFLINMLGLSNEGLFSLESSLFSFKEENKQIYLYYTGMNTPLKRLKSLHKIGVPLFSINPASKNVLFYPGSIPFLAPLLQNYVTTDTSHFSFGSHLSPKHISTYHRGSSSPYLAVFYKKKPVGIGKIISKRNSIIRITNEISLFSLIKVEKQIRSIRFLP